MRLRGTLWAALAALLVLAACTQEAEIRDEIPIRRGSVVCGKVVIRVAGRDDPDGLKEGTLVFDYDGKDDVDGCCRSHGWIQHVQRGRSWRFDNSVAAPPNVTGTGMGAESRPEAERQPGESDRPRSGDWRDNPWFGASTNPNINKTEFARNPKPQKRIIFDPGYTADRFRTSLACVDSGEVVFTWEWSATQRKGKRIAPPEL
jgi:hypothetical protein